LFQCDLKEHINANKYVTTADGVETKSALSNGRRSNNSSLPRKPLFTINNDKKGSKNF